MNNEILDKNRFAAAVRARRGKVPLRDAVVQIEESVGKISPATLGRVERGKAPDVDTFLRLCSWLDSSPSDFAAVPAQSTESKPKSSLEIIEEKFRADNLPEDTTNALIEMIRLAYLQAKSSGSPAPGPSPASR